ncbi:MAG: hypothetical protein PVF71_11190, partial [Desulfobacterales bacterium]
IIRSQVCNVCAPAFGAKSVGLIVRPISGPIEFRVFSPPTAVRTFFMLKPTIQSFKLKKLI